MGQNVQTVRRQNKFGLFSGGFRILFGSGFQGETLVVFVPGVKSLEVVAQRSAEPTGARHHRHELSVSTSRSYCCDYVWVFLDVAPWICRKSDQTLATQKSGRSLTKS